jgi:hypothetical protein
MSSNRTIADNDPWICLAWLVMKRSFPSREGKVSNQRANHKTKTLRMNWQNAEIGFELKKSQSKAAYKSSSSWSILGSGLVFHPRQLVSLQVSKCTLLGISKILNHNAAPNNVPEQFPYLKLIRSGYGNNWILSVWFRRNLVIQHHLFNQRNLELHGFGSHQTGNECYYTTKRRYKKTLSSGLNQLSAQRWTPWRCGKYHITCILLSFSAMLPEFNVASTNHRPDVIFRSPPSEFEHLFLDQQPSKLQLSAMDHISRRRKIYRLTYALNWPESFMRITGTLVHTTHPELWINNDCCCKLTNDRN